MTRRQVLELIAAAGSLWPGFGALAQQRMHTRQIPLSGERLPVIGVGTWQTFDVGNEESERSPLRRVLQRLVEAGGSVIDSSPMYGRSEGVVGELAGELGITERLFMASKVWTRGREAGLRQMEQSLARMGRERLDLLQIHNLLDWRTHLPSLRDWRDAGRLRYLGLTHYTSSAYEELQSISAREPGLAFLQFNYSIAAREAEKRLLPHCTERGLAVLINRPYQGGALFERVRGRELPGWAAELDIASWGQLFLKYVISHPAVTCVIPGTAREEHMLDNLQAGLGPLPDPAQRRRMVDWFDSL